MKRTTTISSVWRDFKLLADNVPKLGAVLPQLLKWPAVREFSPRACLHFLPAKLALAVWVVLANLSLPMAVQAQCPAGWDSYPVTGHAIGWSFRNGGGDSIDPRNTLGKLQLNNGQSGLFRPNNTALLDNSGDTLVLNMGELLSPGSVMGLSLGYFSDTSSRMKIEYSTDLTNWSELGYYSRNTPADAFYSTFGSQVAHHFAVTVPSSGFRYLRFTRVSGSCYVEGVVYTSICRPVNCSNGITPAASVVQSGTINVTRPEAALSFSYPEGQQLYTTTTISAEAALMQAQGNSQLTVDLGTLVSNDNQIIVSLTGWSAETKRMLVYTSTDGVNFTLLSSIGKGVDGKDDRVRAGKVDDAVHHQCLFLCFAE